MKLLVDMNLSPRWVNVLARAGIETAHWSTLGPANAPDSEIMNYAKLEGYVVLTHDLDFSAILAATKGDKPSVVQIRADDISPDAIGANVVEALRQMEAHLDAGALLTIDPSRARLRILPLMPESVRNSTD
jgi:predicted nuclease of predicted toxin-antitoxin system